MPLGILRVAAALEEAGRQVDVLDLSGITNYEEAVRDYAANTSVQVFGITATTPQMPAASKIAKTIRFVRSDAHLVLGGPHVTLISAARKYEQKKGIQRRAHRAFEQARAMFDTLIAGDGERAVLDLWNDPVPHFIDADADASLKKDELVVLGRPSLFLNNESLDQLPWPARHLIDWKSYRYSIDGLQANSLIAQLGCPFNCGFCGGRLTPMLRRVRTRSSNNIVEEMTLLYKMTGRPGFMFYDDELNVNPNMVELMNLIARRQRELGVEWRLRGFVKAELFTDKQAEAMYEAGFRWILVGFESGSPRILKNINKGATLEDNTRCVEIARKHGLKVKALMSIGHPGESHMTIDETLVWLLEVKPDDFDLTIITTYPGTPYYDYAEPTRTNGWVYAAKNGDKLHQHEIDYTEVADYYKGDPDGGYHAYVYTDHISAEELVARRDNMERFVREKLDIPYPASAPALRYEHSMGQSGPFPPYILKQTA